MNWIKNRVIVKGYITINSTCYFSVFLLGVLGIIILYIFVNKLIVILSFVGLIGYGCLYTVFLKWFTTYNIVLGGLFGSILILLGWIAIFV